MDVNFQLQKLSSMIHFIKNLYVLNPIYQMNTRTPITFSLLSCLIILLLIACKLKKPEQGILLADDSICFFSNVGIGNETPKYPLSFSGELGDIVSLQNAKGDGNNYGFGLRGGELQIHTDGEWADIVFGYGNSSSDSTLHETMRIKGKGLVGIGTNDPQHALDVKGSIRGKELITDVSWGDFVFEPDYPLMPLKEVEQFIQQHRHLPGIPPAQKVETEGLKIGEINSLMIQKIEELTLYTIALKKESDALKAQVKGLKNKMR